MNICFESDLIVVTMQLFPLKLVYLTSLKIIIIIIMILFL